MIPPLTPKDAARVQRSGIIEAMANEVTTWPVEKVKAGYPQPSTVAKAEARQMKQTEVLPLVLADITDRVQVRGMATYGKPLTTGDGRDSLWDAYEEILDLAVYIRKEIEERRFHRERFHPAVEGLKRAYRAHETIPAHESGLAACLVSLRCPDCMREQCEC